MPNGTQAHITCIGSIKLHPRLKLKNVLCLHGFRVNLMSVIKLTRNLNFLILFFPSFCILQDLATKKMIGLGKERDGLYYLVLVTDDSLYERSHRIVVVAASSSTPHLWHKCLGHLSNGPLRVLSQTIPLNSF